MFKIFLLALLVVGCGYDEIPQLDETPKNPITTADSQPVNFGVYQKYVDNFLEIAKQENVNTNNLPIKKLQLIGTFEKEDIYELEINKFALGVCFKHRYNTILLQRNLVETAKIPLIKWVIFHELGHCIFDVEHSTDKTSLMADHVPYEIFTASDDRIVNDAARKFMREYLAGIFRVPTELTPIPLVAR
jgi:hypothetical protein